MKTKRHAVTFLKGITIAVALNLVPATTLWADPVKMASPPPPSMVAVQSAYGHLPLSFEANQGQTDPPVQFITRGNGYSLFLTETEAVLVLRKKSGIRSQRSAGSAALPDFQRPPGAELNDDVVSFTATDNGPQARDAALHMSMVGADPHATVAGLEELSGKSHYFIGKDPREWVTNVPNYAKVKYANIYPGVDLVYYGNQGQLEYDFVVQPDADPQQIELQITASPSTLPDAAETEKLFIDSNGDLVVSIGSGEIRFHRPVVYQLEASGGGRHVVEGQYILRGDYRVAFQLGPYDHRLPVVIDPTLVYSTYLGGNTETDYAQAIAVDAAGNAYVTGFTGSTDFPTKPGAFQTTKPGFTNAYVSKLNATGSALIYSTYLGGHELENGHGIAIDPSGNAYVTGFTRSADFPTTLGAFQTTKQGFDDVFVSKLNATGSSLLYSTYLGGSFANGPGTAGSGANAIAVDASGHVYVTGTTNATDFPTTPGAFQTGPGPFINNPQVAFVSKLNTTGTALVYSTYLGARVTEGHGIAVDASGQAYVTGFTAYPDFPTTPGALSESGSGFITKLNAAGSALVYSARLKGYEFCHAIAVDMSGNAYVTGRTQGGDLPATPGAFQTSCSNCSLDAFVTKLNPTGSALVYSTFLSGSGGAEAFGIAVDAMGNASVTGNTGSPDFPTTPGAVQTVNHGFGDAFVSKLNAAGSALLFSTYLGGNNIENGTAVALDAAGNIYAAGYSFSSNFPTTTGALKTVLGGGVNGFVAKITTNLPFAAFRVKAEIDLRHRPHHDEFESHDRSHRNDFELRHRRNDDEFEMTATFTLGTGSNGIAPLTEAVVVQVGTFSTTIPAGSFKLKKGRFTFEGVINGVKLEAVLRSLILGNDYEFTVTGKGADLTGTENPVTVGLTIGDDSSSKAIAAKIK